jgi:hypothetical protein
LEVRGRGLLDEVVTNFVSLKNSSVNDALPEFPEGRFAFSATPQDGHME